MKVSVGSCVTSIGLSDEVTLTLNEHVFEYSTSVAVELW